MLKEIGNSINSVLIERTRSPFFGTFIVSWTIWNWRIIYLTIFVDQDKLSKTKLDLIIENYLDTCNLVWWPLLSTALLLTLVPFITNGAYYLQLRFKKWRIDQKRIVERKQLLTLEQSIALREEILSLEEKFEKLMNAKNLEIKQLTEIIEQTQKTEPTKETPKVEGTENIIYPKDLVALAERIKGNKKETQGLESAIYYIQNGYKLTGREEEISSKFIALLESHDVIESRGNGIYQFTSSGKKFLRLFQTQ